jgi:ATP-dependent Clp protease adaptor protein ClpS
MERMHVAATLRTWTDAPRAGSGPATKELTKTGTKPKEKTELAPPWNVIVHDDPVTLMTYVTMVLRRVFAYPQAKAHRLMMQVHQTGKSIVWTGAKERAEMYLTQLHAAQLLATIEKVST